MKIKIKTIAEINESLKVLAKFTSKQNIKLHYAIAKNLAKIRPEIEAIDKAKEGDDAWNEFEKQRTIAVEAYAKKGDDGLPLTTPLVLPDGRKIEGKFSYVIENVAEFDKTMKMMEDQNREIIDIRKKQLDEFAIMLEEVIDFDFYKIPFSLIDCDKSLKAEKGEADYKEGMPPLTFVLESLIETVICDE